MLMEYKNGLWGYPTASLIANTLRDWPILLSHFLNRKQILAKI